MNCCSGMEYHKDELNWYWISAFIVTPHSYPAANHLILPAPPYCILPLLLTSSSSSPSSFES